MWVSDFIAGFLHTTGQGRYRCWTVLFVFFTPQGRGGTGVVLYCWFSSHHRAGEVQVLYFIIGFLHTTWQGRYRCCTLLLVFFTAQIKSNTCTSPALWGGTGVGLYCWFSLHHRAGEVQVLDCIICFLHTPGQGRYRCWTVLYVFFTPQGRGGTGAGLPDTATPSAAAGSNSLCAADCRQKHDAVLLPGHRWHQQGILRRTSSGGQFLDTL